MGYGLECGWFGTYDHISRASMFEGLRGNSNLRALITFVRMLDGVESTYMRRAENMPHPKPMVPNNETR